jgi:intracellular septation protein A
MGSPTPLEPPVAPPGAASSRAVRITSALRWVFETFGPLLVFWGVEHVWGLVPAIVSGVVVGAALVAFQWIREKSPSKLTVINALSVVVFGGLDLTFRSAFFVKLEPVLGNLVWAGIFLASAATGPGLIVEMVERTSGQLIESVRAYMRAVTFAWGGFFVVRAAAYLWVALHLSIDEALAVRGVVGPASFVGMFAVEMVFRYVRFGKGAFGRPPPEARVEPGSNVGA